MSWYSIAMNVSLCIQVILWALIVINSRKSMKQSQRLINAHEGIKRELQEKIAAENIFKQKLRQHFKTDDWKIAVDRMDSLAHDLRKSQSEIDRLRNRVKELEEDV